MEGFDILHKEQRGSLYTITARGSREELLARVNALNPTLCEMLPLTLEKSLSMKRRWQAMMSRNSCSGVSCGIALHETQSGKAIVLSTVGFFMAQLLPVIMTAQHSLSEHKQDLANLSGRCRGKLARLCRVSVRCSADRICLSSWPSSFWRLPAV